jgi:hypothetical protein
MPSIRGSSQFNAIKGITIYGITGITGQTGSTGSSVYGPTGATAVKYLTGITLQNYVLISSFLEGTTVAADGLVRGVTGNTVVYLDGKTASGGTGYIFVGSTPSEQTVEIRKILGSTGYRASVGITADDQTITINVERYDGEYTLANGDLSQIIATNSSGNLIGVTAAKYGNIEDTIKISKASVFEKTRGGYTGSGSIEYIKTFERTQIFLHPSVNADNSVDRQSKAKIYAIDLNSLNTENLTKIVLDAPPVDSSIGFTLYIQGGKMTDAYDRIIFSCPEGSVVFPFKTQPCFKNMQKYVIHFISVKNTWYGYVFSGSNALCSISATNFRQQLQSQLDFYDGLTGACCKSDGTCEVSADGLCDGFFSGVGTTCGNICIENLGSCCVKNSIDGKDSIYCIENISAANCLMLNSQSVDAVFSGFDRVCSNINCVDCFNELGACCDGRGGCTQQTKENCIISGGSFLGRSISCYVDGQTPVCSSGTGACCTLNGSCTSTAAQTCIDSGGIYFGDGTNCSGITCSTSLGCGRFLGTDVRPGDLLAGGIVVGVYNPKTSKLLGAGHAFSRNGLTGSFLYGGETLASYYQSEYDYVGYGFTGESCTAILSHENADSYFIIASLYPVTVDQNGNMVDPTQETYHQDTFPWYGSGIAWGPMLNINRYTYEEFTYLNKKYDSLFLRYGEGYYGVTGDSLDNIKSNTFQSCYSSRSNGIDAIARLFTRNVKTANGLWNRNWGLYNTIRMICADNADYLGLTAAPYFESGDFDSGDEITAIRALKMFDNSTGITQSTDWYIPSHDELAFIAANCVSDSSNSYYGFNLNTELLLNDGIPLYDWHWTSTGSFDETSTIEGIYVSGKPEHGSVAWAINFDQSGSSELFKVKKETRDNYLKVRPIRAIRCDGAVPNTINDEYKLWKTPNLLRNRS